MSDGDFFRDPDFPDRPQHPDFWRLVGVVNRHDKDHDEAGQGVEEIAGRYIDPGSLEYMAIQRARMAARETGLPVGPFAAVFIDAFCLGVGFEQAGGHQDPGAFQKRA